MKGTVLATAVSGRREAWDSVRGLAVLFMILVHGMLVWGGTGASITVVGTLVEFLGGPPAAPVFLFLMGAGTVVSRRSTSRKLAGRGLMLLMGNYALNLGRSVLPALVSGLVAPQVGGETFSVLTGGDGVLGFFGVDILACAGLSLFLLAGLEAIQAPAWSLPVLGLALNMSGRILANFSLPGPRAIYALAWGSTGFSYFPMLTWVAFPLAGAAWARTIAAEEPEPRRYGRILLLASAALIVISLPYIQGFRDLFPTEESYYHHGPLEALWLAVFTVAWIAILGWVNPRLPAGVRKTLTALSRSVTPIYVLHWLAIGWLVLAIAPGSLGAYAWLVPTLGLCAAAVLSSRRLFLHKPSDHGGHGGA